MTIESVNTFAGDTVSIAAVAWYPSMFSVFEALDPQRVLDGIDGPIGYALVFVLAAIPWLEILAVIPAGIVVGLDPIAVAVFAFAGNVLPIYGIILGWRRVSAWRAARRGNDDSSGDRPEHSRTRSGDDTLDDSSDAPSGRTARGRAIWERYGLPGLAIASPVVTGVHLATVIAIGVGSRHRAVGTWMTASLAVWTILITATTVGGLSLL